MRGKSTPGRVARPADPGFTLLEVLVALVVLGVLLATLAQGMRVGLHAWQIGQRIGFRSDAMEATDHLLREMIGRAVPGDPLTRDRSFTGTPTGMAFTAIMPDGLGASMPLEADVSVQVTDAHRLVLRWLPHHKRWLFPPPAPLTETLLDGVAGLELGFFRPAPDGHGGQWQGSWSSPDPPRLVRLRVLFAPGDPRHWPDLVVATMRERAPA